MKRHFYGRDSLLIAGVVVIYKEKWHCRFGIRNVYVIYGRICIKTGLCLSRSCCKIQPST